MDRPDSAERWLLASQLSQLRDCLRPGLTHLNWHALGIQDFVTPIYKVKSRTRSHTLAMSVRDILASILTSSFAAKTAIYLGPVSCIMGLCPSSYIM